MALEMLRLFNIEPSLSLDTMVPNQSLAALTASLVTALDQVLVDTSPALVIGQGDTTTVLVAALAAFYRRIPFVHVEAGLRTLVQSSPFPEEVNRALVARLAWLHFAPTAQARENLIREAIDPGRIFVVGNPVVDAMLMIAGSITDAPIVLGPGQRMVLITVHRRDNHGEPLERICAAIRTLAGRYADVVFLWPVHPNPVIRQVVRRRLADAANVKLREPLPYDKFVSAMKHCTLILTDSGGVQEEAPTFGKPVLVVRDNTERPEAIESGNARLVGSNSEQIVLAVSGLLDDPTEQEQMSRPVNPYGDGKTAERITSILGRELDLQGSAPT
jgi:UDP-N-acetylglucosamine 2-epimerase (non-hydrolysing)